MTTLNKVIGIVSYLPDDPEIRSNRSQKVCKLINQCKQYFDLPIIVIAQNWPKNLIDYDYVTIYEYEKPLTIVGARMELRQKFLESNYDYLIMLDDDCRLCGDSAEGYLTQIDEHPDCWIEIAGECLKLFAISKSVFAQVNYDDVKVENNEAFEDWIFIQKLKTFIPEEKHIKFKWSNFWEESSCLSDKYSTWWTEKSNLEKIAKTTEIEVNKYKNLS